MVIHHAGCLHMRITDGRSYECEASEAQIFAHRIRLRGCRRIIFQLFEGMHNRSAIHKLPDVGIEASELLLDFQKPAGVVNRGGDLGLVSDDSRIAEQLLGFSLSISGHLLRIEMIEGEAVVFPFSQDGVPTQSGLSAFQDEEFE